MVELGDNQEKKSASLLPGKARVLTRTKFGWGALIMAAVGMGAWVILPLITTIFHKKYPITDTWVMPAIGTVIIDIAAVLNLICIWPRRERSILNVVAAVLVIANAVFITFIVVGEILGGA